MTKRPDRPWESPRWQEQLHLAQAVLEAPSVTVDGIRYWSDRFYLNQIEGDASSLPRAGAVEECVCGARQAPPLLNRERLVQSLDLKAAVLGTFTTNLEWLQSKFPNLVGPNATVPTLLLHGDKSFQMQVDETFTAADNDDDDTCQSSQQHSLCPEVDTSWNHHAIPKETPLQKAGTSPTEADLLKMETSFMSAVQPVTCEKADMVQSSSPDRLFYSAHVVPAWNMTPDFNPHVSNESATANNQPSLKSKRGVHHPKFMLLLESTGDLVVVVSTANLTPSRTTEGTWVQRFSANRRYQHQRQSRGDSTKRPVTIGNDFGVVLQDFLEKLDGVTSSVDIADFFDRYMNVSLVQLAPSFHFEKAQVHLVSVVPGHWKPNCPLYGRQRVHSILQRETLVQSTQDRLLLQPTSLGANWKQGEMADVIRSYLDSKSTDEEALLNRVDLVWPSRSYIRNIHGEPITTTLDDGRDPSQEKNESSFVFLSSQAFNSCDRSCITRLARFESADPPQRASTLVPHFKSIARLVEDHSVVRKLGFQEIAHDFLSWFLLTSACMSHGAQGKRVKDTDPFATNRVTIQYANFELGVLFTSRIHQREKRLYCFHPHRCSCHSLSDPQQKLIHLPIPYSLHPKPYLLHDDDVVMQETPFFHEVDNGTRCVGNMLLTPFGIKEAKKANKKNGAYQSLLPTYSGRL